MASLHQSLTRATTQLRDMTTSQRVAIVLGLALVAGSLAWMAQWAATPEMTPLLEMDLPPEDVARMRAGLQLMNEPVEVVGQRVLVRASANRPALLAQLQQSDSMPADTSAGFRALVEQSNPWISQEENNRRWTVALQDELKSVLAQFEGVKQAAVFLNLNARERGFSRSYPDASASVTLHMRAGQSVPRSLALAAAQLVSGAVRGLPRERVQVIDGAGRPALDWSDESPEGVPALHRLQREKESELETKIQRQLAFDPRALVNVQVVLSHTRSAQETAEAKEGVVVEENTTESTTTRSSRAGQPGVEPNVGVAAASGDTGDTTRSESRDSKFQPGYERRTTETPAGEVKSVSAAINLSYSYLASVHQRRTKSTDPPSAEAIAALFTEQEKRIKDQVAKLMLPQKVEQVAVSWYDDFEPAATATASDGAAETVTATTDGLSIAGRYAPLSGLALLALLALGMMWRMARRTDSADEMGVELGLPQEAVEAARRAAQDLASHTYVRRPAGAGTSAGRSAGGAAEDLGREPPPPLPMGEPAEGVLEAQEIDESTAQIHNMIKQVSDLANQEDEVVAGLVERWMDGRRA